MKFLNKSEIAGLLWTMVHGESGGIISQDLLYIIGEDKQQSWINQIVLSASDPDARKGTSTRNPQRCTVVKKSKSGGYKLCLWIYWVWTDCGADC